MTDFQLYVANGVPIVAVLTSLVVSLVQISGVRDDMRELRRDMGSLRQETRIELNGLRQDVHNDIQALSTKIEILTGKVWELMGRK